MRVGFKILLVLGIGAACLQLIRPAIPFSQPAAEIQAPDNVRRVLANHCYACHSNERHLAWFDYPQPAWGLVRKDILTAREHLNFSTIGAKPAAAQKAALYEAVNMIQLGAMPLPRYRRVHPGAEVTPEELGALKAYLTPWTPAPSQPANEHTTIGEKTDAVPAAVPVTHTVSLASVAPEWNGLQFDGAFEGWKAISFTDRGDNNTFRVILGNDIALKAAQSGHSSPWPDGTRFAKIAWQRQPGANGLVYPGKFVQVELMVKDARRFKSTEGWGWGRWRGLDLKPYGANAHFAGECTSCHLPVHGNDYVYTLPISAAKSDLPEAINSLAALPGSLPGHPLDWSPITLFVDQKARTISTLFGNAAAMNATHARAAAPGEPKYLTGAQLALVTWAERDDPHWFGARIPNTPVSVEYVTIAAADSEPGYNAFAGSGLAEQRSDHGRAMVRSKFITSLTPASLP
jgi:hypothetical protein